MKYTDTFSHADIPFIWLAMVALAPRQQTVNKNKDHILFKLDFTVFSMPDTRC